MILQCHQILYSRDMNEWLCRYSQCELLIVNDLFLIFSQVLNFKHSQGCTYVRYQQCFVYCRFIKCSSTAILLMFIYKSNVKMSFCKYPSWLWKFWHLWPQRSWVFSWLWTIELFLQVARFLFRVKFNYSIFFMWFHSGRNSTWQIRFCRRT